LDLHFYSGLNRGADIIARVAADKPERQQWK